MLGLTRRVGETHMVRDEIMITVLGKKHSDSIWSERSEINKCAQGRNLLGNQSQECQKTDALKIVLRTPDPG